MCNRVESDVCVDSKQNVCLMGVKQIKNGNLVAANLMIQGEHCEERFTA